MLISHGQRSGKKSQHKDNYKSIKHVTKFKYMKLIQTSQNFVHYNINNR
jgi:hypothetical protein